MQVRPSQICLDSHLVSQMQAFFGIVQFLQQISRAFYSGAAMTNEMLNHIMNAKQRTAGEEKNRQILQYSNLQVPEKNICRVHIKINKLCHNYDQTSCERDL